MTLICGACGGQKGSRRLNLCTGRGRRASKFDDARTMPRASTSDEPDILWQLPRRDRGSNAHTPDTATAARRSAAPLSRVSPDCPAPRAPAAVPRPRRAGLRALALHLSCTPSRDCEKLKTRGARQVCRVRVGLLSPLTSRFGHSSFSDLTNLGNTHRTSSSIPRVV